MAGDGTDDREGPTANPGAAEVPVAPVPVALVVAPVAETEGTIEALRQRLAHLEAAQQLAGLGSWRWDAETGELDLSNALRRLLDVPTSETHLDVLSTGASAQDRLRVEALLTAAKEGATRALEYQIVRPDGTRRVLLMRARAGFDGRGAVSAVFGSVQDITELHESQREQEEHLRFLETMDRIDAVIRHATDPDNLMDAVLEVTLDVFEADRAWLAYPCNPKASHWRVPIERTVPAYPGVHQAGTEIPMHPAIAAGMAEALASEVPIRHGKGRTPVPEGLATQFAVRATMATAVFPRVGEPWLFGLHQCREERYWTRGDAIVFQEIGRRLADALSTLLKHRDLEESERRFRTLVEHAADAVYLCRAVDGHVLDANDAACRSLGYSRDELLEMTVLDFTVGGDAARFEQDAFWDKAPIGRAVSLEHELRRKDGSTFPVEISVTPIFLDGHRVLLGIARDISERRRAEEERERLQARVRHAQKMEAIGQLAGGVAHDFNNILTSILGNLELSLHALDEESDEIRRDDVIADLRLVEGSAHRAVALIRQLLVFGRRDVARDELVNANETAKQLGTMLSRLLPENISLSVVEEPKLEAIRMDASQLEQIILNLSFNARDAMKDGGHLTIETAHVMVDDTVSSERVDATPGPHVMLTVSDTGHGMNAETAQRVFEPFFTTKPIGEGTGLGLATVYAIVRRAGGFVTVYSEVGRGTTFKLFFPVAEGQATTRPQRNPDTEPAGGTETILMCEDDDGVRTLATHILDEAGYEVIAASNGEEALDLARDHIGPIHLLVADVIMPGMNGRELAEQLRERRPEMSVMYASGYTSHFLAQHGVLGDGIDLLEKPYSRRALLHSVRARLDVSDSARQEG